MAADPNNSIVVGGHAQAYGSDGSLLLTLRSATGFATLAALKAASLADGQLALVTADGSLWRYALTSTLTGDDVLVALPTSGTGRLLRVDKDVDITAAVTFATADTTVLYTVPTGFQLFLGVPFHHVVTSWTGGTSSAVGASSSGGALTTQGDLLGGSGGDVAAGLLSTGAYSKGTVGTDIGKPGALIIGGDTIRFDRIVSVFTAGASTLHFPVRVILAPAA